MKKILFLVAICSVFAVAGCKKTTVPSLDRAGVRVDSDEIALFGAGSGVVYETYGDSIYFKNGDEYQVFVPKKDGSLYFYKHLKKNGESYECYRKKSECLYRDEDGVIYDKESYGYDVLKKQDLFEKKIQELYRKAKAACKG